MSKIILVTGASSGFAVAAVTSATDPVHVLRVLTGVNDSVVGARSHEPHDGEGDQLAACTILDALGSCSKDCVSTIAS